MDENHIDVEKSSNDDSKVPQHVEEISRERTEHASSLMKTCSAYVIALRPWSFTASLTPVALGTSLAYKTQGTINIWVLLAASITAVCVHAAGNLVNTYFDYVRGVDNKKSDDRTLVDRILSPNDVATLGGIFYFMGCVGFASVVLISSAKMEHLALVYFGGLSGSFLYTGGLGLKYIALGDLIIFLTFGPVTVLFAYMSQGGQLSVLPLIYAIPVALNTETILHSNNARDMETDKSAGIVTLAIVIGKAGSYALFSLLLFLPYIVFALLAVNFSPWFLLPLSTIFVALKYEKLFRQGDLRWMPNNMAKLNLQLGFLYVIACIMTDKSQLPGLS